MIVAVDAMGSDRAPAPEVRGALRAARERDIDVVLVGDRARVEPVLVQAGARSADRIAIHHAPEVVTMDDHPARAFRAKRGASLRVAIDLVHTGGADAVVSAGNSGAVLGFALFVLGRLGGVDRPGIVTVFPTPSGRLVLCDAGANVDPKPAMLAQFGVLGACYDRVVHGHARPRLGLLSNGAEATKGTELTRAAHELLARARGDFQFVGYVEGSDLFRGVVDVIATDGFTGNIVLKTCEGIADGLFGLVRAELESSVRSRVGAALIAPSLRDLAKRVDYSETGGALLAGVDGVVVISHGRSDPTAMKNAILAAADFATRRIPTALGNAIAATHLGDTPENAKGVP
jgi:glycerol-3-phosphate acyltransferase PlsX